MDKATLLNVLGIINLMKDEVNQKNPPVPYSEKLLVLETLDKLQKRIEFLMHG